MQCATTQSDQKAHMLRAGYDELCHKNKGPSVRNYLTVVRARNWVTVGILFAFVGFWTLTQAGACLAVRFGGQDVGVISPNSWVSEASSLAQLSSSFIDASLLALLEAVARTALQPGGRESPVKQKPPPNQATFTCDQCSYLVIPRSADQGLSILSFQRSSVPYTGLAYSL